MYKRNVFLWAILTSGGICCVILVTTFFLHLKKIERQFEEEGAVLSKNNQNIGEEIKSVKAALMLDTETLAALESEKNILEEKAGFLKEENEKLQEGHAAEIEKLKAENAPLAEKILVLEDQPLTARLKNAIRSEESEDMRAILEKTLHNIEFTGSGFVGPEFAGSIETTKEEPVASTAAKLSMPKMGRILLLDRRHNIAVINLGRKDDISEGQTCVFLKDEQDIAGGKIISARYNISACFIDELAYQRTIKDVEKGDRALVFE